MPLDLIPLRPVARHELNQRRAGSATPELFAILDAVKDPEIPVLSIWELGVLQDVVLAAPGHVRVVLTPTYSGCPALQTIAMDCQAALQAAGYTCIEIEQRLSPAWTSDWLEPETRRRLVAYGVAAPDAARCPQCGSSHVTVISEFGSTACKALLRCEVCLEPFDQFKRL